MLRPPSSISMRALNWLWNLWFKRSLHRSRKYSLSSPGMHSFDFVVVASGGGPLETNISAYLLKSKEASWEDGIVALEAGSGMGVLTQLLQANPKLFYDLKAAQCNVARASRFAARIYSYIQTYLISHAHLDHINSLVLTSGSLKGRRKNIVATTPILKDIEKVFGDRLWPQLASWDDGTDNHTHKYVPIDPSPEYHTIGPNLSVRVMAVSHGTCSSTDNGVYESSAFFIKNDRTEQEFLFFGDVEPDSIATQPTTRDVWRVAAPKILDKRLNTIFLECSWPETRKDDQLYGHLSPKHVLAELKTLAKEVQMLRQKEPSRDRIPTRSLPLSPAEEEPPRPSKKRRLNKRPPPAQEVQNYTPLQDDLKDCLKGTRLYVIHCKDPVDFTDDGAGDDEDSMPIGQVIASQIRCLVEKEQLGIEILATSQGMRIRI